MTPATTTMIHARSDHEEDRWFPVGTFLPIWAHDGYEAITPPAIMHASECAANPTWADTPVNAGQDPFGQGTVGQSPRRRQTSQVAPR